MHLAIVLMELDKAGQSALQGSWHMGRARMPGATIAVVCGLL